MQKPKKWYILLWILSGMFVLTAFSSLKEGFKYVITALIIAGVLGFFGYRSFSKCKSTTKVPPDVNPSSPAPNHITGIAQTSTTATTPAQKPKPQKEWNYLSDVSDDGNYLLKYERRESIAMPDAEALKDAWGKRLKPVPEPENEHDSGAIALYRNDKKVGYLHRGNIQDMVRDFLRRGEPVIIVVSLVASDKIFIRLGFYKSIEMFESKKFTLTKITKKAGEYESSRFDNLRACDEGEEVDIDIQYMIVYAGSDEIGELNESASDYIGDHDFVAILRDIAETDAGGLRAKVEIYLRD